MKVDRLKTENIVDVSVDYHTKQVKLAINREFLTQDAPHTLNGRAYLNLSKRETTKLIAALKAQRDRKGVK